MNCLSIFLTIVALAQVSLTYPVTSTFADKGSVISPLDPQAVVVTDADVICSTSTFVRHLDHQSKAGTPASLTIEVAHFDHHYHQHQPAATLSDVAFVFPTGLVVTHDTRAESPTSTLARLEVDHRHASNVFLPRADAAGMASTRMTVAISTIVTIIASIVLFVAILVSLYFVATHDVNIFDWMNRTVRRPPDSAAPLPTYVNMPRSPTRSPVSDMLPLEEISHPPPVLVQDSFHTHHQPNESA